MLALPPDLSLMDRYLINTSVKYLILAPAEAFAADVPHPHHMELVNK